VGSNSFSVKHHTDVRCSSYDVTEVVKLSLRMQTSCFFRLFCHPDGEKFVNLALQPRQHLTRNFRFFSNLVSWSTTFHSGDKRSKRSSFGPFGFGSPAQKSVPSGDKVLHRGAFEPFRFRSPAQKSVPSGDKVLQRGLFGPFRFRSPAQKSPLWSTQ
jgi:hypothetical protein